MRTCGWINNVRPRESLSRIPFRKTGVHFCGIGANGSSQVFGYIVRRLALMLVTLFGISVIIFVLLRIVPGNIVDILFDAAGYVDPTDKANLEKELGLDQPMVVQYLRWIGGLLQG